MYQISVKSIKNILVKEHNSFMESIRNSSNFMLIEYPRYILDIASETTINRIHSCETYADLNDFIHDSRRMSLQEWIDSL